MLGHTLFIKYFAILAIIVSESAAQLCAMYLLVFIFFAANIAYRQSATL